MKIYFAGAIRGGRDDEVIYAQDMAWLAEAGAVVAEVTIPSHGVGYEVARAEALRKSVMRQRDRG